MNATTLAPKRTHLEAELNGLQRGVEMARAASVLLGLQALSEPPGMPQRDANHVP
jgi:hypothetical protein